jgi:restriction endonuclease Mrr
MPQRQSQTHRRRQTTYKVSGGSGIIGFLFVILLFMMVLGAIASSLSSSSGQTFIGILVIGTVTFFVWRYFRKHNQQKAQQQQMIAMQQQEYARQQQERAQQQQQEYVRQQQEYARQQWERIEQERQEREKIARLRSLGDILVLTPREFEELVGKLLTYNGLQNVRHIGGSGDLGVDLTALDTHGNTVIVQCKRYAPGNSVGSRDIQSFIGMMNVHYKAEKGIFVTTTRFTQPASDLAEAHDILLIDGDRLVKLLQSMQGSGQPH